MPPRGMASVFQNCNAFANHSTPHCCRNAAHPRPALPLWARGARRGRGESFCPPYCQHIHTIAGILCRQACDTPSKHTTTTRRGAIYRARSPNTRTKGAIHCAPTNTSNIHSALPAYIAGKHLIPIIFTAYARTACVKLNTSLHSRPNPADRLSQQAAFSALSPTLFERKAHAQGSVYPHPPPAHNPGNLRIS